MAKAFDVDTGGTLETSLVCWYNLEADGTDEFSTQNLTVNGSPSFTNGKIGNAVDGGSSNTTKFLNIATDLVGTGSCSFSFFVNVTTAPTSGNYMVLSQANVPSSSLAYYIFYLNNSGTLQLIFRRAKVGTANQDATSNTTLTTGTWFHIAGTYDGTTLRLYVNNSEVANQPASGNGSSAPSTNCGIMKDLNDVNAYLSGLMDLVGVWTKKLSTTEVSDLYNSGTGNAYRTQTVAGGSTFVPRVIMF